LANIDKKGFYWLIFDIASATNITVKMNVEYLNSPGFWGTLTKANSGSFYIGGWQKTSDGKKHVPTLIKLSLTNE
jgi:hypothetical protein